MHGFVQHPSSKNENHLIFSHRKGKGKKTQKIENEAPNETSPWTIIISGQSLLVHCQIQIKYLTQN